MDMVIDFLVHWGRGFEVNENIKGEMLLYLIFVIIN